MMGTSTSNLKALPDDQTNPTNDDTVDATVDVSESACTHLLRQAFSLSEFPSLIESICSSRTEVDEIKALSAPDAQTFIDVIEEPLHKPELPLSTQKHCLKLLYRTCGHHALLPKVLYISALYDRSTSALYRGTYGDVWKGKYQDRNVAVKVIRTYSKDDLRKIMNKFCKEVVTWRFLRHDNIVPMIGVMMSENQFAMVSDWMENASVVEYIRKNPDVDRIRLMIDAVKGLIYLHEHGMIHGDLKGANILVDEGGHARLVDFGLLTIMSDPANRLPSSSNNQAGTVRWMAPELLFPDQFKLDKSRPTKASDCYSLGRLIYETISGEVPFYELSDIAVFAKLVEGGHPGRMAMFSDGLWEMLKRCWAYQPSERQAIQDVLLYLQSIPGSSGPHSTNADNEMKAGRSDSLVPSDNDDGSLTVRSNTLQPNHPIFGTDAATVAKTLEVVTEKLESITLGAEPGARVEASVVSGSPVCMGVITSQTTHEGPVDGLAVNVTIIADVSKTGVEEPGLIELEGERDPGCIETLPKY